MVMINTTKIKTRMYLIYLVCLPLMVLYVHSIVSKNLVDTKVVGDKKQVTEIHPADVRLVYYAGLVKTEYQTRLQDSDSVYDLLETIRLKNGLKYEKSAYSYGIELDSVAGVRPASGYKWSILKDGVDITQNINEQNLKDGDLFELKMMPR